MIARLTKQAAMDIIIQRAEALDAQAREADKADNEDSAEFARQLRIRAWELYRVADAIMEEV